MKKNKQVKTKSYYPVCIKATKIYGNIKQFSTRK